MSRYSPPRRIIAVIQFNTASLRKWSMKKAFNDERHLDNFIEYICRTKGYTLDEVWYV